MASGVTYCFSVEWLDRQASLVRNYLLYYHCDDATLEMYDVKNRRSFLKRCTVPSVTLKDLYIGGIVTVYARQLEIKDFGDEFTRKNLSEAKSSTIALLKPAALARVGEIMSSLWSAGFVLGKMKMLQLTPGQASDLLAEQGITHRARELAGGPVLALEVIGKGGSTKLRQFQEEDGKTAFPALRDVQVSQSERDASLEANFFFNNPNLKSTAKMRDCSVCVIKPHAIRDGAAGEIVSTFQNEGLSVTAMEMFNLDVQAAEEFLEVYKGVVPEYNGLVEQLCSGPCIAVEMQASEAVKRVRDICGPMDPVIGKHIRPNTIRAQFGNTKVENAVHCTDLPEDGVLESEFFFSILQA